MIRLLKHWFAPPIFPNDEERTHRAQLLNLALIVGITLTLGTSISNLIGGKTPPLLSTGNWVALVIYIILRRWMYQGEIKLVSILAVVSSFIYITGSSAVLGTIRTPTTALYGLLVIVAGLLFDAVGIIVFTALGACAMLGLVLAENAGWLPRPDYAVTVTHWLT